MRQVEAANAALMERTPFAIDDSKDDEDDSIGSEVAGDDDQVMDEVNYYYYLARSVLSSHPFYLRSMRSWKRMILD